MKICLLILLGICVPTRLLALPIEFDVDEPVGSDPYLQGFLEVEVAGEGLDGDGDGLIDAPANAGLINDGGELFWQVNDSLPAPELNLPRYRGHLLKSNYEEMFLHGWEFEFSFRIGNVTPGVAAQSGWCGWDYPQSVDPGWGLTNANGRVLFWLGHTAAGDLRVLPGTGGTWVEFPGVSASNVHTLRCEGIAGGTSYLWSVNGVNQLARDLNDAPYGLAQSLEFGGETSAGTGGVVDWKRVSLRSLKELSTEPEMSEVHRWTFEDLTDSIGGNDLVLNGGASLSNGRLVLDGVDDFAKTTSVLGETLGERTLVAWVSAENVTQQGGGAFTLVNGTSVASNFDGLVFGERTAGQWMNGSNSFLRSVLDNGGDLETETSPSEVMMAVSYGPGDEISVYRNGVLYSRSGATQGSLQTYNAAFAQFGERHPTTNPNRFFAGELNEARIYNRTLDAAEIASVYAQGPTPDVGTPLTGTILVEQLNYTNTQQSIDVVLTAATSEGVEFLASYSNLGDYTLDFPALNDVQEGVLFTSVAEGLRSNSAVGGPSGSHFATSALAIFANRANYFIPVAEMPAGAEFNANVSFGWFSYSDWLGAVLENTANGGPHVFVAGSAGIELGAGQEIVDVGGGETTVNLTGLGAHSADGVLLVNSSRNEENFATSRANGDGSFTVYSKSNTVNGQNLEMDPISFVYLPADQVGTKGLVALGRANADGTTDLAAGGFLISKLGFSRWLLQVPGHDFSTGTLLVCPANPQSGIEDNIVVSIWDDASQGWIVESRDIPNDVLQDLPAANDVFSFAFFATKAPLGSELVSDTPLLSKNAIARQSSTFPVSLPDRTDAGVVLDGGNSDALSNRSATDRNDTAPWLEIELEREAFVESVELLNLDIPLASSCCRSRMRDITIQLFDKDGVLLSESSLLNPENSGFEFPDGPRSLVHFFNSSVPALKVRISRTGDPDLSGTDGQAGVVFDEQYLLELREVLVRGEFVESEEVRRVGASYDSRRSFPDPTQQGFYADEVVVGNDVSPNDGSIDAGANVGIVLAGSEVAWQINDSLTTGDRDLPWYRCRLRDDALESFYRLGWEFEAIVQPLSGTSTSVSFGAVGWGFSSGRNPGWDIGSNSNVRILFDVLRTSGGAFQVNPTGGAAVEYGSADDFHTIRAVGLAGSTEFEWFIDDVSQGVLNFSDSSHNVAGLTLDVVGFGSGASSSFRQTNWKKVSLQVPETKRALLADDLLFYLPFEPGSGRQVFEERSSSPALRPRMKLEEAHLLEEISFGAVGQAVRFSGGSIDARESLETLQNLTEGSLSLWVRTSASGGRLLSFSEGAPDSSGELIELTYAQVGSPRLSYDGVNGLEGAADTLLDGAWHHIGVSISDSEALLFFDGMVIDEKTSQLPSFIGSLSAIEQFWIEPADADLDEVMIWGRALSAEEMRTLYARGVHGLSELRDQDGDGINELAESRLGTSDLALDSDGDTLSDTQELILGTSPTLLDSDGDGLGDEVELAAGTNPLEADSDGDGFDDLAESTGASQSDPMDPKNHPAIVAPLVIDEDNDGFAIYAEALMGTLPDDASSVPGEGIPNSDGGELVLQAESLVRHPNGTVVFEFSVEGGVQDLRVESSSDLTDFDEDTTAVIVDNGGGFYTATLPPSSARFFRAAGESAEGTTSTRSASFNLPGEELALVRKEGETVLLPVVLTSSYSGTLQYEVSGVTPDGALLPTVRGGLAFDNATSGAIALPLYDDELVGTSARYTVTLLDENGVGPGLASSVTIVVEDNDEVWQGILRVEDENLDFVLEVLREGENEIATLRSSKESSFFPQGDFAMGVTFESDFFSAAAANILLNRITSDLTSEAGRVQSFTLTADDQAEGQLVAEDQIQGSLNLELAPRGGAVVSREGTFDLLLQPPPPTPNSLNLQPSN